MLTALFGELKRVTQALAVVPTGDLGRAHTATLKALTRFIEDLAIDAAVPPSAPVHLEGLVAGALEQLGPLFQQQAVKVALERHCLHEPLALADRERAAGLVLLLLEVVLEQCTPGDTVTIALRSAGARLGVDLSAPRLVADPRFLLLGAIASRHGWELVARPDGEPRVTLSFEEPTQHAVPFSSTASGLLDDSGRFDEGRLARLMGGLAEDGVKRLRTSFLETARQLVGSLDPAVRVEGDLVTAHSLKGAAAMAGADVLAQLASRLEAQLRADLSAEVPILVDTIRRELRWLEARLARPIVSSPSGERVEVPPLPFNVLVVDDDAFVRSALAVMLGHLVSKEVVSCASALEALAEVSAFTDAEPLDVVVCDLRMPKVDGVAFLRQLADAQFRGAVIIVSVAEARLRQSVERLARSLGLNVVAALAKPASSGQLALALRRFHDERERTKARARAAPSPVLKTPRWTEKDLAEAIESGGVRPYYQPKVSLRTGQVVGVEALARWVHGEFGVISPALFLPMATRAGLMPLMTLAILERSTEVMSAAPQLSVSVNLEAASACDEVAMARLLELVRARAIPAERLVFELTETDVEADPRRINEVLARLKLRGFRLAIDDFGTGRSTHQRLADIPFTELKIDRQFVRDGGRDDVARAVVETSVVLARRLKMVTTAEGVETQGELDFVRRAGCDEVQGYFFAPPLPFEALTKFLAEFVPLPPTEAGH